MKDIKKTRVINGVTVTETQPISNYIQVAILFILSIGFFVCAALFPILRGTFIAIGLVISLFFIVFFKELFTSIQGE